MGKIYALSDIHGHYKKLLATLTLVDLKNNPNDRIIFLGDYINRGSEGRQVLEHLMNLEKKYPEQVVVLLGNHDKSFIDWLIFREDYVQFSLLDGGLVTMRNFLSEETYANYEYYFLNPYEISEHINRQIIKTIYESHGELLRWLTSKVEQPFYYETDSQIFVHAGIEEDKERWRLITAEDLFLWKSPAETGSFYKDIIAGHVSSATVAKDSSYLGKIYWDGENHFFVDGTVNDSGVIPLLEFDCRTRTYFSYHRDSGHWVKTKIVER